MIKTVYSCITVLQISYLQALYSYYSFTNLVLSSRLENVAGDSMIYALLIVA